MPTLKFEITTRVFAKGKPTKRVVAKLTPQDIDDIMVSALEGGVCICWCNRVSVDGEFLGKYASDQISRGGEITFHVSDPDIRPNHQKLNLMKILDGFALWPKNGGDCYNAVDSSSGSVDCGLIDAICADEIVQYVLFGELVFG